MAILQTPVLIIGGGPVGLCMALFLNFHDVRCTIINTGAKARTHPKGNGQNARTMEHYRQIGIVDEIRKLGLPHDHPFDQGFFTRFSKHEIFRFPCASWNERQKIRKEAPATDQFLEPMYHVNQMYVEQQLFEEVKKCKNVDVRFGWSVEDFSQGLDCVRVHAVSANGSEKREWEVQYVVDCSGGRSATRKKLGIDYVGDTQTKGAFFAGQFYTIWLRIPDLYPKYLGDRRAWMNWAVNSDPNTRSVLIVLNGKDEFELLVKPKPTDGGKGVDPEEVKRWIVQSIGDDIAVEVLAVAPWTAGAALAVEKYRSERIFLAGDAAHLFTPVGAFGMNTGIDDVHNLAWKLAAVLHGWGGSKLLDTYEAERRPIGFRNTGAARKYSSKWHDPDIPPELENEDADGVEARKKASSINYIVNNHFCAPEDVDVTGVQLGARYDESPIILRDVQPPEDKFPEMYDKYHPSSIPGGRAPHLWLDSEHEKGSSLFDRLGKGFTLLRILSPTVDTTLLEKAAKDLGVLLGVLNVDVMDAKQLYEQPLVLVRPDQYIAWRGDRLPADCQGLLRQVCGF